MKKVLLYFVHYFCLYSFSQKPSFTPDITISSDEEIFAMGAGAEAKYALDDNFTSRLLLDFAFNSKHFGFLAATSLARWRLCSRYCKYSRWNAFQFIFYT